LRLPYWTKVQFTLQTPTAIFDANRLGQCPIHDGLKCDVDEGLLIPSNRSLTIVSAVAIGLFGNARVPCWIVRTHRQRLRTGPAFPHSAFAYTNRLLGGRRFGFISPLSMSNPLNQIGQYRDKKNCDECGNRVFFPSAGSMSLRFIPTNGSLL
jgi:hypothetical protein